MAIDLTQYYGSRVDSTDANMPYGKVIGLVGGVEGTGTPVHQAWVNDILGLTQAILVESQQTPSGSHDTATSSQYLQGLKSIIGEDKISTKTLSQALSAVDAEEGNWVMDSDQPENIYQYKAGQVDRMDDILPCTGVPNLHLVRVNKGSNEAYKASEQLTKYTMTPNRHIFGEEYLWGLHKQIVDTNNSTYIEFIWSGDSTTAGDNAGAWKVDVLGGAYSANFGLAVYDHINKGHSGDSAVDWNNTHVDDDIANNPNMRAYIARWGINDGSSHGDVSTYISAMESGLAKLRAFKEVEDLTIIVMSPNSTYDDPNSRGTDWYETIIPELRKICRKYRSVFFDTYSIWQDAKQGALAGDPKWLDDPFSDGRGIHPDAAFNHQIIYRVMSMILEPVLSRPNIRSNTFTNTAGVQFTPSVTTPPNSWTVGMSLWTTKVSDGWLVDGKLRSTRNGNKVYQENFNTGVDDIQNNPTATVKFVRWGDATLNTWTKWYNAATAPTLLNSWVSVSGRLAKYIHYDNGQCTLMGTVNGGVDGTSVLLLPTEMRPSVPRTFITAGSTTSGTIVVNTNGNVEVYMNGNTFVNLDGVSWSAGN